MKIQGTFLSSRAGRRIFWTLLLAAAAPIGVFGVAMHQLLSEQFEAQVAGQQLQLVKFAGMGLLDRLLVARTALTIVARTSRVDPGAETGGRNGRVLVDVAQLDTRGKAVVGSAALAQRWRNHVVPWFATRGGSTATLIVGSDHDAAAPRAVLMVLLDEARPERIWIAEVEPAFLFSELSVAATGLRICVFDMPDRPVVCPGWGIADDGAWRRVGSGGIEWRLFLRSDFAIDDWTLVSIDAAPTGSADTAPLARLSALLALATLLFVGMLGLIQVRRTMVPLEQLIAGTRRLSERDYSARVQLRPDDEFGELAHSFNHMAERIDHQVEAMRVQSSIDHEILNGLNVARVLQLVAQRLEQLVPGATACVVELATASQLAHIHTTSSPMTIVGVSRHDAAGMMHLDTDGTVPYDDPPAWLHAFAPAAPARLWVRRARLGDELLGMLVIGASEVALADAEVQREIAELAGRVSVALASADRERRLMHRATRDSLTGLVNRTGLYDSIDTMLSGDHPVPFSLLFVDLDRFKEINDTLGHQVGDELLRGVACRLQQHVSQGTVVARPGGDEFVLVVRGPCEVAEALAARLCTELARPFDLAGRSAVVGASIGMAHHPRHGTNAADLMRRADMAMYSAKARGGGAAAWFEPALDARAAQRAALLGDLREALSRNELLLHFQPRVQVRTRTIRCAEALLRWRHPTRGFVPAPTFIELLEETGLIESVGLWVIAEAAAQLARWRAQGVALESIAVNLSTRQLQAPDLPERVATILARHGLRPADLELEVTESLFMGDATQAIRTLQTLHDTGVSIALDDFGTGYSSLSYLHKLPIDVVKVDRSFVVELGERDSALALTRSIVALARALDLRVVAEGVETLQQEQLLVALGCDELQGWLYAPALDATAFAAFIERPLRADALTPS